MMEKVAFFFCQDSQNIRSDKDLIKYETRNLDHILSTIIPHFLKYPLQSNKQNDFLAFSKVCFLLKQKKHLSFRGLREILDISYQMNLSETQESRRKQKKEFYVKLLEKKSFQKSPTV